MDIVFLIAAGAFSAAVVALAVGCERIQNRKVMP